MKSERHEVTVTTTARPVYRIDCTDQEWIFLYVKNTGANALNAFSVSRGVIDSAITERFIVADSAAEFADPTLIGCVTITGATADPTTLAANTACALQIVTFGCDYIEISASAAASTTTVTFNVRGV